MNARIRSALLMLMLGCTLTTPSLAQEQQDLLKQIFSHQEQLFELFLPTTNYTSYQELKDRIDTEFSERSRQFDNQLVLAIFAPSDVRNNILDSGFKNQFETNTSQGLLNKDARFNTERSLLGYSSRQYKNIPLSMRPKYGLVTTKKHLVNMIQNNSSYGDDIYIINKKNHTKITWTPGDSLNRVYKKCSDYITDCTGWDNIFIPWKYRHIIIPYLHDHDSSSILVPNLDTIKPTTMLNPIAGSNTHGEYMEFQLWGDAPLSVAKSLIYSKTKLSGSQKKRLKEAGVSYQSLDAYKKRL